jgi:arylsulfatase A-like enzyme
MDFSRRDFLASSLGAVLAQAPLARGQAQRRPNILFAIADDWSQVHAGAYGCRWVHTPAFDRVAREGVLFQNCFTSNPKCSPCRASILTGRNTWQLEEAVNHFGVFPAKFPVYTDLLEKAGYHVGFTGKGWGPGDYKAGGFRRNPAGDEFTGRTLDPPFNGISAKDYAGNFGDFLEARQPGQPFCFWFGTHEPHRAYEDGSGVRSKRDPKTVDLPAYYPDSDVLRRDMLDYALEVEWFDTHLGRILRKLEEVGELENTVVVATSDHGMPFPRVKGQIYEHGFHLPLAIRWGGTKGGRTIDDFINVRDFAPTFLQLAGVEAPDSMTGRSFVDVLQSGESGQLDPARTTMLIGKERHDLGRPNDGGYPVRALRTREYLYIRNYEPDRWPAGNPETGYRNCDDSPAKSFVLRRFDEYYRMAFGKRPGEELYRVSDDPDCVRNLAGQPEHAERKREMREQMEAMLREEGDPRALGNAAVFDTYKYVGARGHAYDTWLKNQNP